MAFWRRIDQAKVFKRCYYRQIHSASLLHHCTPKISPSYALENTIRGFVKKPTDFCFNGRFFAAPHQFMAKKEETTNGPRLNDEIVAGYVRLVKDEGHRIVSFHEALRQARQLKLDLVEVDRKADPPVCKIMDYHRELYQQELREKERAKSKSDTTLRKGECKEVRFAAKTEQKDLKMKADSVVRLMERGYRVKCVAMGSKKKGSSKTLLEKRSGDNDKKKSFGDEEDMLEGEKEDEDEEGLGALLSRLTALIEDVAIVESGPRVEKRQAYVIVRHAKYGPGKKSGAKKLKDAQKVTSTKSTGSAPTESPAMFECLTESSMSAEDEVLYNDSDLPEDNLDSATNFNAPKVTHPTPVHDSRRSDMLLSFQQEPSHEPENKYKRSGPRMEAHLSAANDSNSAGRFPSSLTVPSIETENRYKMSEARNQFSHPRPANVSNRADRFPSSLPDSSFGAENRYKRSEAGRRFSPTSMDSRGQDRRGPGINLGVQNFSHPRPANDSKRVDGLPSSPPDPSAGAENRYKRSETRNQFSPSSSGNNKPPDGRAPFRFESQFSNPRRQSQADANASEGNNGFGPNPNFPTSKSDGSQTSGLDKGEQGRWGIFSRDGPNVTANGKSRTN